MITFAVFLLSLHPDVFQRLRGEVLEVVGPTERPTYENIREMKYLRAVLNGRLPFRDEIQPALICSVRDPSFVPTSVRP